MAPPGPPAAASSPPPDALRLVLFGPPAAGKSSLLGALAQSARTQESLLNGRLADRSGGLAELRDQLYDGRGRVTAEEVSPYPLDYEPFAEDGRALAAHEHLGAVVLDCDGRVANDLLARHEALDEHSPEGTLAREVLRADTLLLVVDASGTLPQVDAEFAEFDRFLRLFEEGRGERTEVGGLPIYLVLTKCDLLARPGDSLGSWMERIEERKRDVDKLFRDFLSRRVDEGGLLPFGQIELHVWATAVKRPALAQAPAAEREPFGVAELFRQCLARSAAFRERRQRSHGRVFWTAVSAVGLVAGMLAMMVALVTTNASQLRAKVDEIRYSEGPTVPDRLRGTPSELRQRIDELKEVVRDPGFSSLAAVDRDFVRSRLAELQEYLAYYEKLRLVPPAGDVAAYEVLRENIRKLQDMSPPKREWDQTDAARFRDSRIAEAIALRQAVERAKVWYVDTHAQGLSLWVFSGFLPTPEAPVIDWNRWYDQVRGLLDPARQFPFSPKETIPQTHLTYAAAYRFDQVVEARAERESVLAKLRREVDVGAALGLIEGVKGRPPLLVIPRPPDFPLDRATARLKELQEAYPNYRADFVLTGLPDAIVSQVRQAARANYEHLLEPGREAVLRQLRNAGDGDEDSPARWAKVGDWLSRDPDQLAAWRSLALVLARLNDAAAADPVTALAAFLQKGSFSIEINQLALEIPFRLQAVKPLAGADLEIFHPATSPQGPAIACVPAGEGERDLARRVTVYRFRPRDRQRLTYRPGEPLWASLQLRDDQTLTWTRGHSTAFQFERLLRPPRLRPTNEPAGEGTLAEGVELTVVPADGVPRVPDLLPVVRPAK
jgi:hypothetical protein